uniref:Caspase 3 n=1 Tax=Pinctada imbricata TaxID=66713 RepID=A0A7T1TFR9_PINIB|nr:caspase 3 [Pinctada imbricata]
METLRKAIDRKVATYLLKGKKQTSPDLSGNVDKQYKFNHTYRGIAIVISNSYFYPSYLGPRVYARKEIELMTSSFSELGFLVLAFKDLDVQTMMSVLKYVSTLEDIHKESDAFAFSIGTHGEEFFDWKTYMFEHILYGTDTHISTKDVLNIFKDKNCKSLKGKPRLFFLQSWRKNESSTEQSEGFLSFLSNYPPRGKRQQATSKDKPEKKEENGQQSEEVYLHTTLIPCPNHFLITYATAPGTLAFGRVAEGGWMLKAVADCLKQCRRNNGIDMLEILTQSTNSIALYKSTNTSNPKTNNLKSYELNDIPGLVKREVDILLGKQSKTESNDVTDYADKKQTHYEYNFNHPHRGIAVVISNGNFTLSGLGPRDYSEIEIKAMSKVFSMLGYIVLRFQDLTTKQMMDILDSVSMMAELHDRSDSFACAIGSHGSESLMKSTKDSIKTKTYHHVIYGTDTFIKTEDIIKIFADRRCKALKGKPKLFFLQACRSRSDDEHRKYNNTTDVNVSEGNIHPRLGDQPHKDTEETDGTYTENVKDRRQEEIHSTDDVYESDDSLDLVEDYLELTGENQDQQEGLLSKIRHAFGNQIHKRHHVNTLSIPCFNNCCLVYATASGNYALGREKIGGWLFHGLFRFFEGLQMNSQVPIDLMELLTIVNSAISVQMESKTERQETTGLKTAVCVEHRLTKDVVFRVKS